MTVIGCTTIDIGPNATSILVLAGPTLSVVLIAISARIKATAVRTAAEVADLPVKVAAQVAAGNTGPIPVTPPAAPFDIRDKPI
jgi:molybdopterin-binding protein